MPWKTRTLDELRIAEYASSSLKLRTFLPVELCIIDLVGITINAADLYLPKRRISHRVRRVLDLALRQRAELLRGHIFEDDAR